MRDLLNIKGLGALIRSVWTWRLLRSAMLVLLGVMIVAGWPYHDIPAVPVRDPLMYTNFTTFNLWVVWMMGMVLVALAFGRSWCTVCPAGWLNGLFSRIGLRRNLPEKLQNDLPVTLTLLTLQLLVYFFSIHRFPDHSALLLLAMIVLALLMGLLFQRRTFCQLLCPAGVLFGLYARIAPWELRVRETTVCDGCTEKPCIDTGTRVKRAELGRYGLQWRSRQEGCPVSLVPAEMADSAECTLCLNCLQNCCNDNVRIGFRPWLADVANGFLRKGETLFFLVLLGLLTANFSKVYVDLRDAVFWPPDQLARAFGWEIAGYYPLAVIWIALLFPLLLMLPGILVYLAGQVRVTTPETGPDASPLASSGGTPLPGTWFRTLFGQLALSALPLMLAAHLVLAVVKLNAKLGYLPLTLQDFSGVKSYLALNVMETLSPPGVLVSLDLLKWIVVGLLLFGLVGSLWAALKLARRPDKGIDHPLFGGAVVNLLVLFALYGATVNEWLFIR